MGVVLSQDLVRQSAGHPSDGVIKLAEADVRSSWKKLLRRNKSLEFLH